MMHIMKVILLLGLCYGLRGGQEIAELEVNNIKIGIFPKHHPLSGKKFLEVNPMNTKKDRLSIYNMVMKETN